MNVPSPRVPAEPVDETRELFLRACADIWDHAREASRVALAHASHMILDKMGGTLIVHAESRHARRSVPEAGYVSEGFFPHWEG